MTDPIAFLEQHRDRHLGELADLLRIPSISTLEQHATDMHAAALYLAERFRAIGLEHVELVETEGNPIVYGDWLHAGQAAPTALLYGHYDVQPADPLALWESPPFEPTIRDERIYARGASDNKGPMYVNVAALDAMLSTSGKLPVNLRFIVEGEEELRADMLDAFLRTDERVRDVDVAVISDSAQYADGVPGIPIGLRGMAALEFTVRTGPPTSTPVPTAVSPRTPSTSSRSSSRRCVRRTAPSPSTGSTIPSNGPRRRSSSRGASCRSTRRSSAPGVSASSSSARSSDYGRGRRLTCTGSGAASWTRGSRPSSPARRTPSSHAASFPIRSRRR